MKAKAEVPTLSERFDALESFGFLKLDIPEHVTANLAPAVLLRPYQVRALRRFMFHLDSDQERKKPTHLLFHMATGSGKTVLMAALILQLYAQGRRNFLFFVNSSQIIEKTRDNFLNPASSKHLFAGDIRINDRSVPVRAVETFEGADADAINIHFTTIQGLHLSLNNPKENAPTFDSLAERDLVMISDEAHHLNALTKAQLTTDDEESSWEGTVQKVFRARRDNLLLEFTATVELGNPAIRAKYDDKILIDYDLKAFRLDGYSKDIELRQAALPPESRMLQAVVLSQHRRKLAQAHGIQLKPVVMMKSRRIADSTANEAAFHALVAKLDGARLLKLRKAAKGDATLAEAFRYILDERGVEPDELAREIRLDFAPEKVANVNSPADLQARQIALNTLEDAHNALRVIFAVDKLNEGWDVLNLFDIVRLAETGTLRTTQQEAQLIGRGARYWPFKAEADPDLAPDKRKFDGDAANPLRLLEQLHYHCAHNPSYIAEIKSALVESGAMEADGREVTIRVKPSFKATELWKSGHIWVNDRVPNARDHVSGLAACIGDLTFTHPPFLSGRVVEQGAFEGDAGTGGAPSSDVEQRTLKLADWPAPVLRFALDGDPFFRFDRLRRRFPKLKGMTEFITSADYLGGVSVRVSGPAQVLDGLDLRDRLEIARRLLRDLAARVEAQDVDFHGGRDFRPLAVSDVVQDRTFRAARQGEAALGWAESKLPLNGINLAGEDWHVYDDCFGTSEEKLLVRFIAESKAKIRKRYDAFHLIRNQKLFRLHAFEDGRVLEPDYLLVLRRKGASRSELRQLYIEPKNDTLAAAEGWKDAFLTAIAGRATLRATFAGRTYRIYGLPFFNSEGERRTAFGAAFDAAAEVEG